MPICYVTVSKKYWDIITKEEITEAIRTIVAEGLDSKSRLLDKNHISLRFNTSFRHSMLADIEIDVYAQFFIRRYKNRDKRANEISRKISQTLNIDCATWINLCQVGYSRFTTEGKSFFSVKEDDQKIRNARKQTVTKARN